MPHWRPGCLRASVNDKDAIEYRPASNGSPGSPIEDTVRDDSRTTTLVDLHKLEGCGLGLIIAGGIDKHVRPHISNLRLGGVAHRSDLLQVGDILVSVNGIKTSAMKHEEIINLLKNASENVRLEIEYELPNIAPSNSFSVRCKQQTISISPDNCSFGFTLRGGSCLHRHKSRPFTVTQIRPGGPADREGSLKVGDRVLAVNDFNIVTLTLSEMNMLLTQCTEETTFTVEYDVSVIDTVEHAKGALLVEIDRSPGSCLGLSLCHSSHNSKRCMSIDRIQPMSLGDRCGALRVGDLILSIDGASVEHMTLAEASQLLKSAPCDQIKMEILPVKLAEKKHSTDSVFMNAGFQKNKIPSISSPILNHPSLFNLGSCKSLGYSGRLSMDMLSKRRKSWRVERRAGSCVSVASTTNSVFTASNQVCRMEVLDVVLYGERAGLGVVLESNVPPSCILQDPPIVTHVQPNTASARCGVIQEGDRILTINGEDCCEKTLEEINILLAESWQHAKLEVEFDVADTVMASSGVFVVKLPRKHGGLGITLSAKTKLGNPILITEVKKGSTAYRCGSVQSGDKLISINDIRTDNLSIDEAVTLLKGEEEIIKLKLKREDPLTDMNGEDLISYTVELERKGGPLGVTITGTDDPSDPIVISALIDGGLAARTGALQIGDRVLAINSVPLTGKTLTEATNMLFEAGDLVTMKIARKDKSTPVSGKKYKSNINKSSTPVRSIDSALESWDSSAQDIKTLSNRLSPRPNSAIGTKSRDIKRRRRPYSSDSTDTGDDFGIKMSRLQISDEAWEGDRESSRSDDDSSPEGDDWVKAFKNFKTQVDMLDNIPVNEQHSTGSLDRRSMPNNQTKKERNKVRRNWSHSTSRSTNQGEFQPYVVDRNQRRCASVSGKDFDNMNLQEQLKTVTSPQSIQLHRVTLVKDPGGEDFGFGVSESVTDRGVYISAIKPGSVAQKMGLLQFDRILQINKKRFRDQGCTAALSLITEAGNVLDIVVCRNPINKKKMVFKDPRTRKPLPPHPASDNEDMDLSGNQSTDSIPVYMNVYNLDTPIARSEKSCKTV